MFSPVAVIVWIAAKKDGRVHAQPRIPNHFQTRIPKNHPTTVVSCGCIADFRKCVYTYETVHLSVKCQLCSTSDRLNRLLSTMFPMNLCENVFRHCLKCLYTYETHCIPFLFACYVNMREKRALREVCKSCQPDSQIDYL